jgi:phage host-nuclease inhibitor protein Gam
MKKWLPLLTLVVVPVAQAEEVPTMDTAAQATVETAKSSTPAPEPQKQIEDLQREVATLKAEVNSDPSQSGNREYASDVDSHPNWP